VKALNFFAMLLAVALLAGCKKTGESADVDTLPVQHPLPTHAQAKLATMKIYLGAETLDTELALTEEQIETGMMYRTNIQDSDSMLFDLRVPQRASFWMYHCPESISAAYISPDGMIREIHHLEKMDTNAVIAATDDIRYVLETSDGWFARHHVGVGTLIRTENGSLAETFSGK
jgi:uncharacterized protein